ARVYIFNNQLFRHVESPPGWKLQWDWEGKEVIWSMQGAEAYEQGNCHKVKGNLPHCCKKTPQIIDLLPGVQYNMQTANCCKGGVLTTMNQDPTRNAAMFQMHVGNAPFVNVTNFTYDGKTLDKIAPKNFSLGLPGYTCDDPVRVVPASKFPEDGGRRFTEAFLTWNITCTYSQFLASPAPTCCVSLSSFYNETITPCPLCSCGCRGQAGVKCVKPGETHNEDPLLQLPHGKDQVVPPLVMCTHHMCPVRVHWHIKKSYKDYWRVKITINNLDFANNYTQWNLVVQHPNLRNVTQAFSFNYKALNQYGSVNDTGMLWGLKYYNDMLLQFGPNGNVQTEILLHKDPEMFTFREGWAYPRRIYFNGQQCVMPPPDDYPRLPNNSPSNAIARPYVSSIIFLLTLIPLLC
ncbi:Cobra-like protein, partial [Thalictrum thalictroides]